MRRSAGSRRPASQYSSSSSGSGGGAPDEVVLDVNELAAVHGDYVQVGQVRHAVELTGAVVLAM
jgi:hypothetical protein